ncbi:MAG TPA: DUF1049 domain-containing protein [Alphaproteobacteria bacterium]|jgi:uncharacterized integral membrane protein
MRFRRILVTVLIGLAGVFIVQNLATMEMRFLLWSVRAPGAVLLLLTFLAGFAAGYVLGHRPRRRPGTGSKA